jgi:adenine phosphoribosyltransferase
MKRTSVPHSSPARRAPTPRGKTQAGVLAPADAAFQRVLGQEAVAYLQGLVRSVPDFPTAGILFRDISPVLADARGFAFAVEAMAGGFVGVPLDAVVAIEARGFVFGAAIAHRLGTGFVPIRKPGKLPGQVARVSYSLEYGQGELQMHKDALWPGAKVLVVDDVLATGGTADAACELVTKAKASVVACTFLIELVELEGSRRIGKSPVLSVLKY